MMVIWPLRLFLNTKNKVSINALGQICKGALLKRRRNQEQRRTQQQKEGANENAGARGGAERLQCTKRERQKRSYGAKGRGVTSFRNKRRATKIMLDMLL